MIVFNKFLSFGNCGIIGDKVWLQRNATDQQIAEELVDAGIPREAIVLGIHPPRVRQFTDFAVA